MLPVPSGKIIVIVVLGLVAMSRLSQAQSAEARCFRFDRPLGESASGALERSDSTWQFVQLGDSGIVRRPLRPRREREAWLRKHQWSVSRDTVRFRVGDGLVGWDVSMWRTGNSFTGIARYLTDVIAKGWEPPRVKVHALGIKCPPRA